MEELRQLLNSSVDALVTASRDTPQISSRDRPYSSAFAKCTFNTAISLNETTKTTFFGLLRRHGKDLVMNGKLTNSLESISIEKIGFIQGIYKNDVLDLTSFHELEPFQLKTPSEKSIGTQLECVVSIPMNGKEFLLHEIHTKLPDDFWISSRMWSLGCTFGGFTFPMDSTSKKSIGMPSFNGQLHLDRSSTNMFAVDAMLFNYSAPSVTSYLVLPKLHQDESLSYKSLSKQQMQEWAVEKRKQAKQLVRTGKLEEGIADYTIAIDMDKEHVATYIDRASLYLKLKKYSEAKQDVHTALGYDPHHVGALELQQTLHNRDIPDPNRLRMLLEEETRRQRKEKKKKVKKEKKSKHKSSRSMSPYTKTDRRKSYRL